LYLDRYVLLGNHRDSWVYGAVDPSSGTAVMMEVSRVMAELVNTGNVMMEVSRVMAELANTGNVMM
jgi:hypothetical protein